MSPHGYELRRTHAGKRGNTNARKHGWYSTKNPTPTAEIINAGMTALSTRDFKTLGRVVRVLRERGRHTQAAALAKIVDRLRLRQELRAQPVDAVPWDQIREPGDVPPPSPTPLELAIAQAEARQAQPDPDPNPDGTDPA